MISSWYHATYLAINWMFLEDMMTHWESSTLQGTDVISEYFRLGDATHWWQLRKIQYQLKVWVYSANYWIAWSYGVAYNWTFVYLNPVVWA